MEPLVSFTFDDFPHSALHNAGRILEERNLAATYYTSLGLMGKEGPTGELFKKSDLPILLQRNHELACHTFDHFSAWDTNTQTYANSVLKNASALGQEGLQQKVFTNHSFPISFPRLRTKRWLSSQFKSCRAGGQSNNTTELDLMLMRSYFIEQSAHDPLAIKSAIEENSIQKGWLILSTHDVEPNHTKYGCSPKLFELILDWSIDSGAKITTVSKALDLVLRSAKRF